MSLNLYIALLLASLALFASTLHAAENITVSSDDVSRSESDAKPSKTFPDLPKGTTSFGACVSDGYLYTYGGQQGAAHHYSTSSQSDEFLRLNLRDPQEWKTLPSGPKLQGLAMVAHDGLIYRLGGFTALNAEGEEHQLQSRTDVAIYDPKVGEWREATPLPEPRSSFDAVVLDGKLYVAGGWNMQPDADSDWHDTAWVADLSKGKLKWESLPTPPFVRRAVALAAHDGKVWVIGGMQSEGGPTKDVNVFDPHNNSWSKGPELWGEKSLEGFGPAAWSLEGSLYATTISGKLQRLNTEDGTWDVVRELERPRFFHRMLPLDDRSFIAVGGGSMQDGRFTELDVIPLP
ncbi:Kelch repeat-containing protein [Calycomorphotria hydatis]|uniref:N-acetylneuraminate epimerase n=1 Tax=Calycomorphotria hydatis TaxID=2528027 RepID=A0A517TAP9_9PLAN|nr:kelch repeat-containing protein [Calycomorphotria hydatis]QDT65448.1 N-acetylneuraminate epimerase [Calycomorphotria hydatis]